MIHETTTKQILGVFYEVYNELGGGFLESVYGNAMGITFSEHGICFEKEKGMAVWFHGQKVGEFRADFLIEGKVIVELKAGKQIDNTHIAQTINYLKATGIEVGLLLNFGPTAAFKRLVKENHPRKSA